MKHPRRQPEVFIAPELGAATLSKAQETCLGASFDLGKVDPTVRLAWFFFPGRFQRGFLSLRDPAPSEPGHPFRQSL